MTCENIKLPNNTTSASNSANAFALFNSILNEPNPEPATATATATSTNSTTQIEGDTTYSNTNIVEKCLISGVALDNTVVKLPCNHSFNYLPLVNDLIQFKRLHGCHYTYTLRCPYCRTNIRGTLPYRPDISNLSYQGINKPVNNCYEKHACINTDCSKNATIPIPSKTNQFACYQHYKKHLKHTTTTSTMGTHQTNNTEICNAILKTGKRKGQICGAKTAHNTSNCKRHSDK